MALIQRMSSFMEAGVQMGLRNITQQHRGPVGLELGLLQIQSSSTRYAACLQGASGFKKGQDIVPPHPLPLK